jgi:DNA gyrase inhibitor GyrI
VACAAGFGAAPEALAWQALLIWARQQRMAGDLQGHRFFGFSNRKPTPGNPNYGCEQGVTVGPIEQPARDVIIKKYSGGLYAVTRCQGPQNNYETWKDWLIWCEKSEYIAAHHQCREECLSIELLRPDNVPWDSVFFDLYLPSAG